ncbi:unnamed protein product [Gordionus sp. m RMFG-2023]|uniref:staphylococcal nuclease domain-containing protein 1-like n=1 Tax=Gordionus sp. m RMFG-2023 TaxID=3053472 RepID=UPI0030E39E51
MSSQSAPTIILNYGTVKQVLSGDSIVVRGVPKPDGPPAERQICLTNIVAPRLGRRPTPVNDATPDEPYAWESREYLRKKLIGQEVCFTIDYKVPTSGREYGYVYLGKDIYGENIVESLIKEGLAEVRKVGMRMNEENHKLLELEDKAKDTGKGKWNAKDSKNHIRSNMVYNVPELRNFIETKKGEVMKGIVEHVRDGSTLRILLLPDLQTITLMISGIKCPTSRREGDQSQQTQQEIAEPFFEEARFFTESRLLQRDVEIICEGTSNAAVIGTVLHAKGNIAEFLLKEGFAKCVEWSMASVSYNTQRLKNAEKFAKDRNLRLWKDYVPVEENVETKETKAIMARVVEIINAESMMVKIINSGETKKIFLSSIRGPKMDQEPNTVSVLNGTETSNPTNISNNANVKANKPSNNSSTANSGGGRTISRPLYEIPYLFEAREFLRKKLIGKKVSVNVDYVQPASMGFPEKICCTVTYGGVNVAGALVSKGFATVVRYSNRSNMGDPSQSRAVPSAARSPQYEDLLAAEAGATKRGLGVHSSSRGTSGGKPPRILELSGSNAKTLWPGLARAGPREAVVEYVASGARVRLYLTKESWLVTFLLAGVNCPRGQRPTPGGGGMSPAEPFSQEATEFTREAILQKDVEIEVESMDRAGNVIGWLHYYPSHESGPSSTRHNLSVDLVEASLADVHFGADRTRYADRLREAQGRASAKGLKIWSLPRPTESATNGVADSTAECHDSETNMADTEPEESTVRTGSKKMALSLPRIVVTEINPETFAFYCQAIDKGDDLIEMMTELRKCINEQQLSPSMIPFVPKKGELCASKFSDNEWYRARIEKINGPAITIFYIDYGNREITDASRLTFLPSHFVSISPQAKEYYLACVVVPSDEDFKEEALHQFRKESFNKEFLIEPQYKLNNLDYVTLYQAVPNPENDKLFTKGEDFVKTKLITEGYLLAEPRRERKLFKLVDEYKKAQEHAKKERKNLWRYGDFTPDDAFEFGFKK